MYKLHSIILTDGSVAGEEDDESDLEDFVPMDSVSQDGYESEEGEDNDDDDKEEYETMSITDAEGVNYDEKIDYESELDALQKLKGKNCVINVIY